MSPLMINEVLAHPQDVTWLPWAVQYFFFIGIAACSALLACGLHGRHAGLERLTLLIGLTCAIAAPLALTADLHQTARVWHFYAWPTPWSWMPWGALFLPLFTGFIGLWFIAATVQHLYGKTFAWTRWMAYACALTAIGLLLYTGREVSVVRARPIWFSWWFPLAMFLSAFQTLLALLTAATRTPALQQKLARGLLVTLGLLGITVAMWISGDTLSGAALRHWLAWPRAQALATGWAALWLLTLIAALFAVMRPLPLAGGILLALASMALSWLMRWTLLIEGQTLPKYNALFNPYTLPMGTDGLLAIVGTFGLWMALLIIAREIVNGLMRRNHHA